MNDPLGEVLSRLKNVQQRGNRYVASCPTRRDNNPSLSIAVGEQGKVLFKDFGGSTVEEIVAALGMKMSDLFVDDPRARREWVQEQRPAKKPIYKLPTVPEEATFHEGSTKWFAKRGISEETMKHFRIYTESHYFHKVSRETPAICTPYVLDGKIVNVKYRSATIKDFSMPEGAEPCWFNLDAVAGKSSVVCVEGEMDVMALYEAGITNVISPPNGCQSVGEEVMNSGKHFLLDETVRVILAGDADKPGQEMMDDIARRVGKERCARVIWPDGCKDANDTLMTHGPQRVAQCVREASPLPFDGVIDADAVMESMWSIYGDGLPSGVLTGIGILDKNYTVLPGYWTMVTGAPSSGKTQVLNQIAVNIAERDDWHFGICSLENPDPAVHGTDLLTQHMRKPIQKYSPNRMTAEEFEQGGTWVTQHFHFIKPEEPTIASVLLAAKGLVFSKGIKGLVVDPWNELDHPPSGLNSGDYISKCLSEIRQFAYRYGVHIWLVAHPTKLTKDANGQYPVPTMYDVSGSAHFFNKADYGISVWRDWLDPSKPVQVHVQKSRRREIATRGVVLLNFDPATGRYYDPTATGEEDGGEWRPKTFTEQQRQRESQEFVRDDSFFAGALEAAGG